MWNQLRGAFHVNRFVFVPILQQMLTTSMDQYETMAEALATCPGRKYFLELQGSSKLSDNTVNLEDDIVLVLGNTFFNNMSLLDQYPGTIIRINTPGATDLYGINAAAIALAHWYGQ